MAITYEINVDWDGNDFMCRNARPTDAPNLLGAITAKIGDMKRVEGGAVNVSEIANDYGAQRIIWQAIGLAPALQLGFDGVGFDCPTDLNGLAVGVLWIRSTSASYNTIPLTLKVFDDTGALVATSGTVYVNYASGWVRVTCTGYVVNKRVYLELSRGETVAGTYDVAGPMVVYNSAPNVFNAGAASLYENMTAFVNDASWSLGFNKAYQDIAAAGRLRMTVLNTTKVFSPEYAASPIYGNLRPQRKVVVRASSPGATDQTMWTGWIEDIQPQTGITGGRLCEITAADARKFLDGKKLYIDVQTDKTAKQLIYQQIFPKLDLPNTSNFTPTLPPPDEWEEIFPYALDNQDEGIDALRLLRDVVGTVNGKVWFTRGGGIAYRDLRGMGGPMTVAETLNNTFTDCQYQYGKTLINECIVTAYRRKISSATDKLLWSAEETITLDPGESDEIIAGYKNPDTDNDRTISGLDVYVVMTADGNVNYTLTETNASSATIMLTNFGNSEASITLLEVRGQKLTAFNMVEKRDRNETSIAEFGIRSKRIDNKMMSNKKSARRMASYYCLRFGRPFGEVKSVTLKPVTVAAQNMIVQRTMGQAIRIIEDQTGHDGYYIIIGEEHSVQSDSGTTVSKWYLEPVFRGLVLGDPVLGMLDAGNYPAPY